MPNSKKPLRLLIIVQDKMAEIGGLEFGIGAIWNHHFFVSSRVIERVTEHFLSSQCTEAQIPVLIIAV